MIESYIEDAETGRMWNLKLRNAVFEGGVKGIAVDVSKDEGEAIYCGSLVVRNGCADIEDLAVDRYNDGMDGDSCLVVDLEDGKEYETDLTFVSFPSGKMGQRLEMFHPDMAYSDDFGTLILVNGEMKVVQW